MVAVSVQLFRVGRTIVSGWSLTFGHPRSAENVVSLQENSHRIPSGNVVYNDRMQSLVGAIERSAATTSHVSPANQRAIILPHRFDGTASQAGQQNTKLDRRISRGPASAVRAPVKAIRNAA